MRRRRAERRKIAPDPIYNSERVAKFINMIMMRGKKTLAQRIVYSAFKILREKTGEEELKVFYKALDNVRPRVEVRPRRVGGATYQIPMEVPDYRGYFLAMKWIRDLARARKGRPMHEKLADELLSAYRGEGAAVKKKEDTHKMAEANKAFAHFRW